MCALAVTGFALSGWAGKGDALKIDDVRFGFKVAGVTELPEVGGRLWRLVYEKNGAQVAWLDRADDNKTFGISFCTLPTDHTGVAHIMEHSVLCGSAKYPVKEPFVDLLKSSLATFLNAFTANDQTVYPVSSRNEQDFLNLVDVYLDAVFHPRSVETPVMFQQEGWHYEFAKDGSLVRNGVVYNEMKGVYANPESVAFQEIDKLLFPDTVYKWVSGGDPAHIGELTFEMYRDFYRRHYHPSNAKIFLDGTLDIDRTLAKLDAYLKDFGPRAIACTIEDQKPVARTASQPYAIGPKEDPKDKTILCDAWVFGRFDELLKYQAADILTDLLADSNDAPLKKALIEKGLCDDMNVFVHSQKQLCVYLLAKNVPDGKAAELRRTVADTLSALARKGLDHTRLAALVDRQEFRVRERFSGGGTCGLGFMNDALDQWLYGGDPARSFTRAPVFAQLRANLKTDWFEKLLLEMFVSNPHHACLDLVPSRTYAAERAAAEKAELAKTLAGWDDAAKARVKAETAAVDAFRNKKDTPEDCAKLPVLALADIPKRSRERTAAQRTFDGVNLLLPAAGAKGVFYASLRFAVDDFTEDELAELPFLATVLGELATEKYDALALHSVLDSTLGRFHTHVATFAATPGNQAEARTVFVVDIAALDAKTEDVCRLVPEVLLRTRYVDEKTISALAQQDRLARERVASTINARHLAKRRAAAAFSAKGRVDEILHGFAQLRHRQAAERRLAAEPKAYFAALEKLAQRVFVKNRLHVTLSDNLPPARLAGLFASFPEGKIGAAVKHVPGARTREGFTVASESGYAAKGSHFSAIGAAYSGSAQVAARLLSLTYLWDEIRVKGGAYGGGLQVSPDGYAGFLSWRDPTPKRSLDCYGSAAAFLRKFATGSEALDRYIVGTLGATDPCLTPAGEVDLAADLLCSGRTFEDMQRTRGEILATTKDDLAKFAEVLDKLNAAAAICVVGGQAGVGACSNTLDKIEAVVPDNK